MMSIRVLCIVADGVEETELVAPVDILRRAGGEVAVASHLVGEGVAQEIADAIMA